MLAEKVVQTILTDYDKSRDSYFAFTEKVEHLLREILGHSSLNAHSVTSRVKDRPSLENKLRREDASYESLPNVTDLSGVRITTYFHDDVDMVAKLIREEFEVVPEHSIDKRAALDPDRFGYLSLHYVVKLPKQRTALIEYKRFPSLLCEIQIRSILQHAWAEIEHDLGYKANVEVPKEIRRQFSRLAGLLELADQEFARIREDLKTYGERLSQEIKQRPAEVGLDKLSLEEFIRSDATSRELDQLISRTLGAPLSDSTNSERLLRMLKMHNIKTIAELKGVLNAEKPNIEKFLPEWAKERDEAEKSGAVLRGVSIQYSWYIHVARNHDLNSIEALFSEFKIGRPDRRRSWAIRLMNIGGMLRT
jgi:putative GTP pyrophosphokinase